MKLIIKRKTYNTDTATQLGFKYSGEFGEPNGYEERLYVTAKGQHFIYGTGGPESLYSEPAIKLLTDGEAKNWKKENNAE